MSSRISEETKERIRELYDEGKGLKLREIAAKTEVSYSTVYGIARLSERINPETGEPFTSSNEYQEYRARQNRNPETGQPFTSKREYERFLGKQRRNSKTGERFPSNYKYQSYCASQKINPDTGKPFSSAAEYNRYIAAKKINAETGEPFGTYQAYQDYCVRQRINPDTGESFSSQGEYKKNQAKKRKIRPENQRISKFIKGRLRELGRTQTWLAKQIKVSDGSVSSYVQGVCLPKPNILSELFTALQVPYQTIDDLVEDTEEIN